MFLAAHLMYNKHPKSNILPSPPQLPKGIIRLWSTPVLNNNKKEHNAVATQETFNLFWWKKIAAISRILRGMLKKWCKKLGIVHIYLLHDIKKRYHFSLIMTQPHNLNDNKSSCEPWFILRKETLDCFRLKQNTMAERSHFLKAATSAVKKVPVFGIKLYQPLRYL